MTTARTSSAVRLGWMLHTNAAALEAITVLRLVPVSTALPGTAAPDPGATSTGVEPGRAFSRR